MTSAAEPKLPVEPTPASGALALGWARVWGRAAWLLCVVPLVGVVELVLHLQQTSNVVPESAFVAARDAIKAELQPDDLIVFTPFWTDPLGRQAFGELATIKREARSDERRFARAFEVSIRGFHEPAFERWKKLKEDKHGPVTVTLFENPDYTKVLDDLVELAVTPDRLAVFRVEGATEVPCPFQRGQSAGGSTVVPQGLLTPADKFVCPNGHVGVSVLHALDHRPHVCLYATPLAGATLRLRFANVTFGAALHGHAGVQWVVERNPSPEKIPISFFALDRPIGTNVHRVGTGWTGFELPTPELAGKKAELVVDIGTSSTHQYCFEATTRLASTEALP